ncbi:hypothetical protein J6590_104391 [Homalodisca vitripennis]|nr:hypothetical protein J6590_104391 [Homalodisca vitripennis]
MNASPGRECVKRQRLANRQDRSIPVSKTQYHTNHSQKAVLNLPELCLESSLIRRPHRRALFKSGSYERGIQHFECRSASHASGRSKKETKIPLGSLAHIKYMLLRAKIKCVVSMCDALYGKEFRFNLIIHMDIILYCYLF